MQHNRILTLPSGLILLSLFCGSCHEQPKRTSVIAKKPSDGSKYVRRSNYDRVIVFVHGVFGDGTDTWTNPETHVYWPQLLTQDDTFKETDIYVYSYSTPYLNQAYNIDELIENMRLVFANDEIFEKHKSIVFLCHSMGGLVVRGYLKRYQNRAAQVSLAYFFSTPTAGAHITNLAKYLTRNPQIRGMLPANSENYVSDLQRDWRALPRHVNSRCAYEKFDTDGIRIVDEQSASALCDGPVDPIAANHIGIVKPKDNRDLPYIAFSQAYKGIEVTQTPPSSLVTSVLHTARSVDVKCAQTREDSTLIPPPIELTQEQHVVDAVASLQQASNIKDQTVEAQGLQGMSAKVHYRLVGLDLPPGGRCPGIGFGIILVSFIVSQPADLVDVSAFRVIEDTNFLRVLAAPGGVRIAANQHIPAIAEDFHESALIAPFSVSLKF
jgi:pimeloyl-ACP methyl ester carboxylesterase